MKEESCVSSAESDGGYIREGNGKKEGKGVREKIETRWKWVEKGGTRDKEGARGKWEEGGEGWGEGEGRDRSYVRGRRGIKRN